MFTTRQTRIILLASLLALAAWPLKPASAQPPENRGAGRARTFLVVRLAEALDLPEDKALQLSAIIRKSDEQRRQLRHQRNELETKLRAALDQSPADSAALSKLIAAANEIDQQLALVPEQSFHDAQNILTVEQQAKLVLFRPELQGQIRRAVRRRLGGDPERPHLREPGPRATPAP